MAQRSRSSEPDRSGSRPRSRRRERGLDFTVYEAADSVGGYVRRWGHVRLFTPWDMNVSPRARAALGSRARRATSCRRATSSPIELLDPLAATLGDRIRLGTRVLAIGREGLLKHEAIGSEERADAAVQAAAGRTPTAGRRSSTPTP